MISAEAYGYSAWTITGRITTVLPDGTSKRYFLKVKTFQSEHSHMFRRADRCMAIHSVPAKITANP